MQFVRQKQLCCSYKFIETSIRSWTNIKKVHKVIQFNQEAWLGTYIVMNTEFRKQAKNDFKKDFFKLIYNSVLAKAMENVRKYIDIKLVATDKRRIQSVSEPTYHTTKW